MQENIIPSFYQRDIKRSIEAFQSFIIKRQQERQKKKESGFKTIIACKNHEELTSMQILMREQDIELFEIKNIDEVKNLAKKALGVCIMDLETGFETENILFVSARSFIGQVQKAPKKRKKPNKSLEQLIRVANKLHINDLVVHKDYGICVFKGIENTDLGIKTQDMIQLLFKNKDELFLPVWNIDWITKYGSNDLTWEEKLQMLDSLESGSWARKKKKAKQKIREIAFKLVKTAASRQMAKADSFICDSMLYDKFDEDFEFELTQDQYDAIEDVKQDLAQSNPADRLICGDVGFGKTEVAMRASFIVTSGKLIGDDHAQVGLICPTTLLAKQHYNNFKERFKNFDIKIALLSSKTTANEKMKIKEGLKSGKVDIVISTHSLLSKSVEFNNLKLLIIDEEQHFGVKQKEKLKEGRGEVHVLSLSATPIPRTLQMSLAGVKELSVIATPPVNRRPVLTTVIKFNEAVIKASIVREMERGGRTFFVCPRIKDLQPVKDRLAVIIPEANVAIAHGQLKSEELDKIMLDFYEGKYDILLTTTIIESGIDISFVNNLIIYNADRFGMSSLYQLRGRVGRGNNQAYCYFIVEKDKDQLSKEAIMRLKTLASIRDLGVGFNVATSDLDIRGAGNMVGDEQSGNIKDVGVELYQSMIAQEITKLKNEKLKKQSSNGQENEENEFDYESFSPEVKMTNSIFIPDTYITDFNSRLELYRRISDLKTQDDALDFLEEISDRFGKVPDEMKNLVKVVKIKQECKKRYIKKMSISATKVTFEMIDEDPPEAIPIKQKLIEMASNREVKLQPDGRVVFGGSYRELFGGL